MTLQITICLNEVEEKLLLDKVRQYNSISLEGTIKEMLLTQPSVLSMREPPQPKQEPMKVPPLAPTTLKKIPNLPRELPSTKFSVPATQEEPKSMLDSFKDVIKP